MPYVIYNNNTDEHSEHIDAIDFGHTIYHVRGVHHHHTAAGHILICPDDDCALVNHIPGDDYYDPEWSIHDVFGPAVHDHNDEPATNNPTVP